MLAALLVLSALTACRGDEFDISDETEETDVEAEDELRPFLLARKFLPGKDLVMGKNTTIAIELYNAGKRSVCAPRCAVQCMTCAPIRRCRLQNGASWQHPLLALDRCPCPCRN